MKDVYLYSSREQLRAMLDSLNIPTLEEVESIMNQVSPCLHEFYEYGYLAGTRDMLIDQRLVPCSI